MKTLDVQLIDTSKNGTDSSPGSLPVTELCCERGRQADPQVRRHGPFCDESRVVIESVGIGGQVRGVLAIEVRL